MKEIHRRKYSLRYMLNACLMPGRMLPASTKGLLNTRMACSWWGTVMEPRGSASICPVDGTQVILSDYLILEEEGFLLRTIVEPWHFFLSARVLYRTLEGKRSARQMPERIKLSYICVIELLVLSRCGNTFICSLSLTVLVTSGTNLTQHSLKIHYVIDSFITVDKLY